jgi:hypothetical protein
VKPIRRIVSGGAIGDTVNSIIEELARLQIQSTPQVQVNEGPRGMTLKVNTSTYKRCLFVRHTVSSEMGVDGQGAPVEIGLLTLEVPANLLLPTDESDYDNRSILWKVVKLFTIGNGEGSGPSNLLALPQEPTEHTFNSGAIEGSLVGSETFGTAVVFTLTAQFVVEGVNPFYDFAESIYSMWDQVVAEVVNPDLWNPIHVAEGENLSDPERTYIKVPYWLAPIGYTAPFIDVAEKYMGHELTGSRTDVVAICKVRVYATKRKFANQVTGALDGDCAPVDNSTPVRWYSELRPGWYFDDKVIYALLRNAGSDGSTYQIAMEGPNTQFDGKPIRWLIPTELRPEWSEQQQRIEVDTITETGVLENDYGDYQEYYLDTQVEIPVFRCIKDGDNWKVSAFTFNAWQLPDADGSFNPRDDAVAMTDYIDFDYSTPPSGSFILGSFAEITLKADQDRQNCDFDPEQIESPTNRLTLPYYLGGWKLVDSYFRTHYHDQTFGIVKQECGGIEYMNQTATEENETTWHTEEEPLDNAKPPQTIFFAPFNSFQNPYSQLGFASVSENATAQPDPCP